MERAARADLALLERVAHLARPVALAQDQTVPVHDALGPLLPDVGLRRGQVVAVGGPAGTSLALLLAAAPSAAGAWVGVVGVPGLGLLAAAEMGVALERLVLVAAPEPAAWASVAATLVDAVDIVLLAPPRGLRTGDARRLQARVRERGAVVVHLTGGSSSASGSGSGSGSAVGASAGSPFEADLVLTATAATWHGLAAGSGRLVARQVAVTASGRDRKSVV
jgi:hypothetical protein